MWEKKLIGENIFNLSTLSAHFQISTAFPPEWNESEKVSISKSLLFEHKLFMAESFETHTRVLFAEFLSPASLCARFVSCKPNMFFPCELVRNHTRCMKRRRRTFGMYRAAQRAKMFFLCFMARFKTISMVREFFSFAFYSHLSR